VGLGYVLFAALQSREGSGPAWLALITLPVVLGFVWAKTVPPTRGVDPIDPTVRSAARVTAAGVAMLVASWTGVPGTPTLIAAANVGTGLATLAALVSLARIAPGAGLLQPPPATKRMDAISLVALFWGIAVAVPLARSVAPESTTMVDPLAMDYATLAAAAGALGLTIAAAMRVRTLRRLELGVADRAAAALALSVVTLAIAAPAALLRVAPPERVMTAAAAIAAVCVQFACISREPTGVAKTMRTVLGIVMLGAPVGLAGVALSLRAPQSTGLLMLVVGGASVLVGIAAPLLARPLGPARSRWLEAINRANEAALHPDPDVAVRDALATVRSLLPGESASPVVFQVSPAEMLTIDRAGYVHAQEAEAPEHLYEIADGEPERTVRTEVLRALEVRRPDLRPLVQWLDARGLLSVTLVRDEDGPVGLLCIPRAKRRAPMNLEEVRAVRVLADRIGAVLGVSSALARSRAREMELRRQAERRGDEIDQLEFRLAAEGGRVRASAERLAQPLQAKVYSPAATMALEQARRMGALGVPVTLLTPPGVDPVPWGAVAHLASARAARPLVIVRGTDAAEHELDRWRDAQASPLTLADGGTLLVVDVPALPRTVQDFIAASLAERVAPSGSAVPLDVWLAVSVPTTVDALVAAGRLSSVLADWLGDRALGLPPLSARSEDLRALVLDQLARVGARFRGAPLGIDDRALARLMEHRWPGNDIELADVLLRAALNAQGTRVTLEDLEDTAFVADPLDGPAHRGDDDDDGMPRMPIPRRRGRRRAG
jgi:hypothetical protein